MSVYWSAFNCGSVFPAAISGYLGYSCDFAPKKKDGAPDLTPGTFLEDEEKMLSVRSPRDFTELKDPGRRS